jgi:hypothetical protein
LADQVSQAPEVNLVWLVMPVLKVQMVPPVQKVQTVHEVSLVFQADKVHQVQMVNWDHEVDQVHQLALSASTATNISSERKSNENWPPTHTSSDAITTTDEITDFTKFKTKSH